MANNNTFLEELIFDIEHADSYSIEKRSENETFELLHIPSLWSNLSGGVGTYFIRAFLNKLEVVDEHRIFRWRLENKYIQFLILNYYIPKSVASTFSFSEVLRENNGVARIEELCDNGFFIKSTLGDSTGRSNSFDRTAELNDIISSHQEAYNDQEKWMLQERLPLKEEYRIHTIGRDIIYGLSYRMSAKAADRTGCENFVQIILEKLPDAILQGTLIGWDIGITHNNEFYVIEANFTGFHPEYGRGFQTSGYFGDPTFGPVVCAWFNLYFKSVYKISIGAVDRSFITKWEFYKEFMFYASVLTIEHLDLVRNNEQGINTSGILYINENLLPLYVTLLEYFQQIFLAEKYYVILKEDYFTQFNALFTLTDSVVVIAEHSLFTPEEYKWVQGLNYNMRKDICCQHALGVIDEQSSAVL